MKTTNVIKKENGDMIIRLAGYQIDIDGGHGTVYKYAGCEPTSSDYIATYRLIERVSGFKSLAYIIGTNPTEVNAFEGNMSEVRKVLNGR